MRRQLLIFSSVILSVLLNNLAIAQQAGLMSVPVFTDAKVESLVAYDSATGLYTYNYTITNPTPNTGKIGIINIDISLPPNTLILSSAGLTIPYGFITQTFDEAIVDFEGDNVLMVPVGILAPLQWHGSLGGNGTAWFLSGDAPNILPGETQGGFGLISRGLPTIRQIALVPEWVFIVESEEDVTSEMQKRADEIEASLLYKTKTLGPTAVLSGSFDHWNQLRDDLNQAVQLGWIQDAALSNTLVSQLALARQAVDMSDGTLAKSRLQTLLTILAQSTAGQRRQEAYDLVLLNVQKLIESTPDTPIPYEPKAALSPQNITLPIGTPYVLTATLINLGDNKPIAYLLLRFQIMEGPHTGLIFEGTTDAEGKLRFSYTGTGLGTDIIKLYQPGEVITEFGSATVTWKGGPDLIIELLIPPMIQIDGPRPIPITEITANIGSTGAAPSVTRYFLSDDENIDPAQDRPIGERTVVSLGPGENGTQNGVEFQLPYDIGAGTYYLGACADADKTIAELDEQNNCQVNQIVVPLERPTIQDLSARAKDSKVDLLWTPVSGAVSYNIYRGTKSGGPYQMIKAGHVTTYAAYADFGLTNGVTYYYIVKWLDTQGQESPKSNEANATPVSGRTRR